MFAFIKRTNYPTELWLPPSSNPSFHFSHLKKEKFWKPKNSFRFVEASSSNNSASWFSKLWPPTVKMPSKTRMASSLGKGRESKVVDRPPRKGFQSQKYWPLSTCTKAWEISSQRGNSTFKKWLLRLGFVKS